MNIKNYKHVVFCGEHYNPLGVIRSLGESGIRPDVVVLRSRTPLASNSKWIANLHIVDSKEEGLSYLLSKYKEEDKKPFLYTCDDKITSYLDLEYEKVKAVFTFFNAGRSGRITEFMNKNSINELAVKHGLNVLDAVVASTGDIPDGLQYPVITKTIASTVGAWKDDVFICNSEDELRKACEKIQAPTILIQKYIDKKNEYCLEGFSVNQGNSSMITIASSYNYLLPDYYSPYMTVHNFDKYDVSLKLVAMMQEIGFEGIYEVEFLVDDNDKLWFCEINFRNSTWSYASTKVGMPLPVLWATYMLQDTIDGEAVYRSIPENFTAMVEINDWSARVKTKQVSVATWVKDFIHSDCKYYLGAGDIRPVVKLFTTKLSRIFGR